LKEKTFILVFNPFSFVIRLDLSSFDVFAILVEPTFAAYATTFLFQQEALACSNILVSLLYGQKTWGQDLLEVLLINALH
jgi:hypothetical protein